MRGGQRVRHRGGCVQRAAASPTPGGAWGRAWSTNCGGQCRRHRGGCAAAPATPGGAWLRSWSRTRDGQRVRHRGGGAHRAAASATLSGAWGRACVRHRGINKELGQTTLLKDARLDSLVKMLYTGRAMDIANNDIWTNREGQTCALRVSPTNVHGVHAGSRRTPRTGEHGTCARTSVRGDAADVEVHESRFTLEEHWPRGIRALERHDISHHPEVVSYHPKVAARNVQDGPT
jgi:hypothetical protein